MKTKAVLFYLIIVLIFSAYSNAQNKKEVWTENQLIQPSELAKILNDSTAKSPYIFSIGPAGFIKNAVDVAEAMDKGGLKNFKAILEKLPKDAEIVFYCGCCPYDVCPNIRPPFKLLKDMKFTNYKLLNLPQNLKVDWIDKGYPMKTP